MQVREVVADRVDKAKDHLLLLKCSASYALCMFCLRTCSTNASLKDQRTRWAQVNGINGETDGLKIEERVACDSYYLLNWSFGRRAACISHDIGGPWEVNGSEPS
jgi:hypothetical protein